MIVFEGEPLDFPVPFFVEGDLVVPDAGSAKMSVYDHEGNKVVEQSINQDHVIINGTFHTIAEGREFEKRIIIVSFRAGGKLYTVRNSYQVVPFLPFSVSADDVRAFIGIKSAELPDDEIDLFSAYIKLSNMVGSERLKDRLTSGTVYELRANDAICMVAVLDIIPSLMQRVLLHEADGVLQFRRHVIKDFNALEEAARARLAEDLIDLGVNPTGAPLALFSKITSTDVITGE